MIPHTWYLEIASQTGKPDYAAISIFSEIVYWYRPDKEGHYKFFGDLWQTSYEYFERKFGYNKQKIRRAFVRLEELGLITRIYRTVVKFGQKYPNVLFIQLIKLPESTLVTGAICKSVNTGILTDATCNDLVLSTDTSAPEAKEKIFYSSFEAYLYKSDTPSLQICRDHIKEEKTKENIKEKDQILRRGAQSNFYNFSFSSKGIKTESTESTELILNKEDLCLGNSIEQLQGGKQSERGILKADISMIKKCLMVHRDDKAVDWEEGRGLFELADITKDTAARLNKNAGRDFSQNFITRLIKKLGVKNPDHVFYRKKQFEKYMTLALANEILQAPQANNTDFKFKCVLDTGEEKYTRISRTYLKEIENSLVISDEMRLKKKIAGRLDPRSAYEILTGTSMSTRELSSQEIEELKKEGESEIDFKDERAPLCLEIKMLRPLRLNASKYEEKVLSIPSCIEKILLEEGKGVYGDRVRKIRVDSGFAERNCRRLRYAEVEEEDLEDSYRDSSWERVKKKLRLIYGNAAYKTWFKALTMEEEEKGILRVKTPSNFMRDWIKNNYGRQIEEIMQGYFKQLKYLEFV